MQQDEVSFGRFRLDLRHRKLTGEGAPIELKSKVFDILAVLASAQGEVVTKDELMAKVWPGLVVEESNIQVHVSALRKALGEARDRPVHLFTVPGRGYRLVGAQPSPAEVPASQADPRALPDRPSIAVLPFQNMSSDAEQEYFADGMVEDIITGLSRIKWLFVIARNSSFTYKGQAVDVKRIGRELGVRYVLEGSVRKAGQRVRISGQLIDTETGTHLWANRFDGCLEDVFDLQDELTMSVVGAIEPTLQAAEIRRSANLPTNDLTAYDLYLRALPHWGSFEKDRVFQALDLLGQAVERDPHYGSALALAAFC